MRTITGTVVSNKMDKTIVVSVARLTTHPLYKKQYKTTTKYKAHDENNECGIGDVVDIVETRPISRHKTFKLAKIVSKNTEPVS